MVEELRDECGSMYGNDFDYESGNIVSSEPSQVSVAEKPRVMPSASLVSDETNGEEYDNFDGDAVHLGDVNIA